MNHDEANTCADAAQFMLRGCVETVVDSTKLSKRYDDSTKMSK